MTAQRIYDASGASITNGSNGIPEVGPANKLRAYSESFHDARGRVFRQLQHDVNQSNGNVGDALATNFWHDERDLLVKTVAPGGLVTRTFYDGAGRLTDTEIGSETIALEKTHTDYDANGNAIFVVRSERNHDGSGYRESYIGNWYDEANRLTDTADYGTNGPADRPVNPPVTTESDGTRPGWSPGYASDERLVTSYRYDDAGGVQWMTDARGIRTRREYDSAGRIRRAIEAYTNGTPTDATNRTVEYEYNADDQKKKVTSVLPEGRATTEYDYSASVEAGDALNHNGLLSTIRYPKDFNGGSGSFSDGSGGIISNSESFFYNALGEVVGSKRVNSSQHQYTYDAAGRLLRDQVTTLPAALDGAIRALSTEFDALGRATRLASHNENGATINEVARQYNGFGQLKRETQTHTLKQSNAQTNSTTTVSKTVQYGYSSDGGMSGNHSRPTTVTYPNGRVVSVHYANTTLNNSISRAGYVTDNVIKQHASNDPAVLENYEYLGLGTVVGRKHTTASNAFVRLTTSLDDFGRVSGIRWTKAGGDLDHYSYAYDNNGNVLSRRNHEAGGLSELFHPNESSGYDALNRSTAFCRGTLSSQGDAISNPRTQDCQSWELDARGNREQYTDGTRPAVTATFNDRGENTAYTYRYGNLEALGVNEFHRTGQKFDAWDRLVLSSYEMRDANNQVIDFAGVRYEYDALGRVIREGRVMSGDVGKELFYSAQDQVIEEYDIVLSGMKQWPSRELVWSPAQGKTLIAYNDLDVQDRETTHFVLQEADGSVTGLVYGDGQVIQRFAYDPQGRVSVFTDTWADAPAVRPGQFVLGAWTYFQHGDRMLLNGDLLYHRAGGVFDPLTGAMVQADRGRFSIGDSPYDPGEVSESPWWKVARYTGVILTGGLGGWAGIGYMALGTLGGGAIGGSINAYRGGDVWEGAETGAQVGSLIGSFPGVIRGGARFASGMIRDMGYTARVSLAGARQFLDDGGRVLVTNTGMILDDGAVAVTAGGMSSPARSSSGNINPGALFGNAVFSVSGYGRDQLADLLASGAVRPTSASRAGVARRPQHHVFADEYREMFRKRGIDIDDYVVNLTQAEHGAIHGGGNWRFGRAVWSGEWNRQLIFRLRRATRLHKGRLSPDEIIEIGRDMLKQYGIDRAFVKYRGGW